MLIVKIRPMNKKKRCLAYCQTISWSFSSKFVTHLMKNSLWIDPAELGPLLVWHDKDLGSAASLWTTRKLYIHHQTINIYKCAYVFLSLSWSMHTNGKNKNKIHFAKKPQEFAILRHNFLEGLVKINCLKIFPLTVGDKIEFLPKICTQSVI